MRPMVLKLALVSGSPQGLVKTQTARYTPEFLILEV